MDSVPVSEPVAIVMAAGKSTRMKSETPKILHELCGQPVLQYVLDALTQAGIRRKLVVVGFQADKVKAAFANTPGVEFVLQAEQLGTGHAVMVCEPSLREHQGPVVVIAGDQPMIRPELIADMLRRLKETNSKGLIATAVVPNPFGLGRILRDANGNFIGVVEQKDATPEQARINEINPSFYAFDGPLLFDSLRKVRPENAQKEYYLTDVPGILRTGGYKIVAEALATEADMYGINHRGHLAEAHRLMQDRIHQKLFDSGVTIVDPRTTSIDARAIIGQDTIIYPNTVIGGPVCVGRNCKIGPFAHLRPETELADGVIVGAFVEVVRSKLGEGTAARHLAYLGDATLGKNVNVGGGCITANFDAGIKSQTKVGDGASLGSGSVLIAPVTVGDHATVGAGAIVTKNDNVPPGATVVGTPAHPMKK